MTGNRKVLFLTVGGRNTASSRYRVFQYLPSLEDAGYSTRVIPRAKNVRGLGRLFRRFKEEWACLEAAGESDIVFIQKRLFSRWFLKKLKGLGKKIVFDLDDNIFTSPDGSWSAITRKRVEGRIRTALGVSDLVVAGNKFLAERALGAGAAKAEVLPTCIDTGRYKSKDNFQAGPVVLGWIGSSVNHPYLDMLAGVLPGLASEFAGLKLLVVSDKDYSMDGIDVINRRWSEETEADDLLDMDIGLMPLSDDEWTRGKCALKALQYMACGVPVVCSAVGANKEVVASGIDGLLADTDGEWTEALRSLLKDPRKRADIGLAGRDKVVKQYSLAHTVSRLIGIMETV